MLITHEHSYRCGIIPQRYFLRGRDFRIILHPIKGLSGNVKAFKNALRLAIEYVFFVIPKDPVNKGVAE